MLTMVMAKPIQLTMVNAVPLSSGMAFWATKVENKGESAITTIPQNTKKTKKSSRFPVKKTMGSKRQQHPESKRAVRAVFLVP